MEGRVCHTTRRYNINGKVHQCLEHMYYEPQNKYSFKYCMYKENDIKTLTTIY
jgi:hypothetical protein